MRTTFFIRISLVLACCLPATLKAQNLFALLGGMVQEFQPNGTLVDPTLISAGGSCIAISGNDIFIGYSNGGPGGAVAEYTTSGATVNTSLITGLTGAPGGLAISGNDIFVVNYGADSIGEYTTSGATVNASLITGLDHPQGIAISGNDIFVENGTGGKSNSNSIGEYTTSGTTVNATLITGLDLPTSNTGGTPYSSIAISGNDIFVANTGANVIGEYTTSGATVNASLVSINTPTGLAISGDDIYTSLAGDIFVYTTSGSQVGTGHIHIQAAPVEGIAFAPVPEPSMVGLLLTCAAAGFARYRRKGQRGSE